MKEIIYHGSENIIQKPIFGVGSSHNDYGKGFYCTKSVELAKEWACGSGNDGYANQYELNLDGLKILNLNDEKYSILNWLAVLTKHRTYWQNSSISADAKQYLQKNFYVDLDGYDVIIGYRADDSYFSFAQDFVGGLISLPVLSEAMRLGELGEQIVLKSEKAFKQVQFLNAEAADADTYFALKADRDKRARKKYRASKGQGDTINQLYMLDIMREEIGNGDPRLR